jgi:hypothetical protein
MATINFYVPDLSCTAGATVLGAATNNNYATVGASSAVGYGYTSSAWPNHILKDATARYANLLDSEAEGDNKTCGLRCISMGDSDDTDSGYGVFYRTPGLKGATEVEESIDIDPAGWDGAGTGRPEAWETNILKFSHGSEVQIDEIQLWVSSGSGGTGAFNYASTWIMEASASGSQDWNAGCIPTQKLDFGIHTKAGYNHFWNYGLSMSPVTEAVGFCNWGYLQVSITYS